MSVGAGFAGDVVGDGLVTTGVAVAGGAGGTTTVVVSGFLFRRTAATIRTGSRSSPR